MLAIEAAARHVGHEGLEAERIERERLDAERERLRGVRLRRYRRELEEEFDEMAASWRKAAELRQFLAAYNRALPARKRDEGATAWFSAMTVYVERLDPLTAPEGVARELDPTDEELEDLVEGEEKDDDDYNDEEADEDDEDDEDEEVRS